MTLTAETRGLLESLAGMGLPPLHTMTPSQARAMREAAARIAAARGQEPVAHVQDAAIEGPGGPLAVRSYTPESWTQGDPALVYFHGGGWVLGNLDTHDGLCRALANASGFQVTAVDYRLAPEHPHPAALEDAWAATRWMVDQAWGPVIVGGDSAGGHLATCVAARARDTEVRLAAQLLVYPVTDLSRFDTTSYDTYADGYWLTRASMDWFRDHYLAPGTDPRHPDVSPLLREDVGGMPPALVVAAECDVLRDEGRAYAERLRQAGCPVDYRHYAGVIHGFFAMPDIIPEGRRAIAEAAAALRTLLQEVR